MRVRRPELVRRWLRAYAAATSTTTSYETIRDAATGGEGTKPSKRTTMPYRDILERLWILDPVPAWIPSRNPISRLSHPPKRQLADPALAARLLGATAETLLAGEETEQPGKGPLVGPLFESLATLSVRVYAQAAEARVGHLRTFSGEREIDLIVERGARTESPSSSLLSSDHECQGCGHTAEQIDPQAPITGWSVPFAMRR